jgi:hypothetical protein
MLVDGRFLLVIIFGLAKDWAGGSDEEDVLGSTLCICHPGVDALVRVFFVQNLIITFRPAFDFFEGFRKALPVCFHGAQAGHLKLLLHTVRKFVRGIIPETERNCFKCEVLLICPLRPIILHTNTLQQRRV